MWHVACLFAQYSIDAEHMNLPKKLSINEKLTTPH